MSKKYPGYNENDTFWDNYHKERGLMTNREFFISNSKGGFYEGMEWDGNNWVPDAESERIQAVIESRYCQKCNDEYCSCWCSS
jgi:hypothetical protein